MVFLLRALLYSTLIQTGSAGNLSILIVLANPAW